MTTEEFGWRSVRSAFSHLRAVFDIYWQYMQAKRLHEQQQAQVKAGETSASPLVQVNEISPCSLSPVASRFLFWGPKLCNSDR